MIPIWTELHEYERVRSMGWTKNLFDMPIGIWTWIKNDSWPEEIISWKFISFLYFQEPIWNRLAACQRWRFSPLNLIRRAKLWLTTKRSARNGTATFAKPLLCLRCSLSVVLCPSIVCRFGYDAIDAIMTQFNLTYKNAPAPFCPLGFISCLSINSFKSLVAVSLETSFNVW